MSSTFRAQAQRLLYHSIDLSDQPIRKYVWAAAVSKHAYLAEFVHSLVLRLPDMVSLEASTANKLGRALSKCVNLKELRILAEGTGSVVAAGHNSFYGWMLNKCSFRLTHFENQYFDDTIIRDFWRKQSELLVVSSEHNVCAMDPDLGLLPQVIAFNTNHMGNLPVERPLQRIETRVCNNLNPLKQYEATLTTLNLTQIWINRDFPIGAVIKVVAETLPNLVHLGIIEEDRCRDNTYHPTGATSKAILQKFTKLQTFLLQLQDTWRFVIQGASDTQHALTSPTTVCDLGREIMTVCPTLRQTAIHVKIFGMDVCVLTRPQPGGTIREVPGPWPGIGVFSMFWKPANILLPVHQDWNPR